MDGCSLSSLQLAPSGSRLNRVFQTSPFPKTFIVLMGNTLYSLQKVLHLPLGLFVVGHAWKTSNGRCLTTDDKPPHLALINTKELRLFHERLLDVRDLLTTVTLPRISVISHFLSHTFQGSWPLMRFKQRSSGAFQLPLHQQSAPPYRGCCTKPLSISCSIFPSLMSTTPPPLGKFQPF